MNYPDGLALELENLLMPFEEWLPDVLTNFPDDVKEELEYIIRWDRGEETHMPHPTAIGFHPEYGWFCLGTGQGPFVIWIEDYNGQCDSICRHSSGS